MPPLTTKQRQRLRDASFALPEERKYPINDIEHARAALARVAQHGSKREKELVRETVYRRYPGLRP